MKLFRLLVRNDFYAKLTVRKGWIRQVNSEWNEARWGVGEGGVGAVSMSVDNITALHDEIGDDAMDWGIFVR